MPTPEAAGRARQRRGRRLRRVSPRPAVDVVLPFRGSDARRSSASPSGWGRSSCGRATRVTIADNRPRRGRRPRAGTVRDRRRGRAADLLPRAQPRGRARARRRGSSSSTPTCIRPPDLLDRYFARAARRRGRGAGGRGRRRGPPGDGDGDARAARYAWLKSSMSQEVTLAHGEWAFAQTANAAVRRAAFEQVGGFEEGVRSGGDADLCFRVRAAGWALERREEAAVVHRNRATIPRMLAQRARHGAGAAWLARRWPGRAAAPALAGPCVVERAPRGRGPGRRRARRSRRRAARPARRARGVGVRARAAHPEPAAAAAAAAPRAVQRQRPLARGSAAVRDRGAGSSARRPPRVADRSAAASAASARSRTSARRRARRARGAARAGSARARRRRRSGRRGGGGSARPPPARRRTPRRARRGAARGPSPRRAGRATRSRPPRSSAARRRTTLDVGIGFAA